MMLFKKGEIKDLEMEIDKKIKKFIKKFGKTREIKELTEIKKQDKLKDDFFDIIFKLSYTSDKKQRQQLIKKAKNLADKIPELRGWPDDSKKFWDVEAYAWLGKIPKKVRTAIKQELLKKIPLGNLNISIGSGSYPYIEESVLLDFSREMLKSVPPVKFKARLEYDLEKGILPFKNNSFDNAAMVFIIDYIKNLKPILKEVKRILKPKGKLILVNTKKPINKWYRKHEIRQYSKKDIKKLLTEAGFKAKVEEKKIDNINLLIAEGVK
jgi:SAM-dependent methyltransferase